jgi:ribosomal protein S18 acetylase RimI-like enzyme
MSSVQVRPFRRADREQLTALVNAHIQAVVPGVTVSVNTVLSQLERDPGEFIVDPWVAERATLVAEQRRRVVAAAHLQRYGAGEEVGEAYRGSAEVVLVARVDQLPRPSEPPLPGLELGRALGVNGTRLSGHLGDKVVGYIEVDTDLAEGGRLGHLAGWADVGNLHVDEAYRRRGVATWLVGHAADWLRLARVDRLLDYAWPEEQAMLGLLAKLGFRELTRTARGWVHRSTPGRGPEAEATPGPPPPARP